MTPRTYSSPHRQAEAARTRRAIVDAAAELFGRQGYVATTMKDIAVRAGTSIQSVHLAGPKSALLMAAFERTFAGDEGQHSLAERPALAEIMVRPDTMDAVQAWLDYVAEANARTAGIVRAMAVAAETDPTAAAALADLDGRRRRDFGIAARWLRDRALLRSARLDRIADELNHLIGPETYAFFVTRSGWTTGQYRSWLQETLFSLLDRRNAEADASVE